MGKDALASDYDDIFTSFRFGNRRYKVLYVGEAPWLV